MNSRRSSSSSRETSRDRELATLLVPRRRLGRGPSVRSSSSSMPPNPPQRANPRPPPPRPLESRSLSNLVDETPPPVRPPSLHLHSSFTEGPAPVFSSSPLAAANSSSPFARRLRDTITHSRSDTDLDASLARHRPSLATGGSNTRLTQGHAEIDDRQTTVGHSLLWAQESDETPTFEDYIPQQRQQPTAPPRRGAAASSARSFSSGVTRVGVMREREETNVDDDDDDGYLFEGYDATAGSFLNRLSGGGGAPLGQRQGVDQHRRRVEEARREVEVLMGQQRDHLSDLRRLREEARERRERLLRVSRATGGASTAEAEDDVVELGNARRITQQRRRPAPVVIDSDDSSSGDEDAPPEGTCPSFWFTGTCPDDGRCPFLHTLGRNALTLQQAAWRRRERLRGMSLDRRHDPPPRPTPSSSSRVAVIGGPIAIPTSDEDEELMMRNPLLALSNRLSRLRERVEEVYPTQGGFLVQTSVLGGGGGGVTGGGANGPLSGLVGSLLQFLEIARDQAIMQTLLEGAFAAGGARVPRGVPEDQLSAMETFEARSAHRVTNAYNIDITPDDADEQNSCSICLCELTGKPDGSPTSPLPSDGFTANRASEGVVTMLAKMPKCQHVFHAVCLTTWLKSNITCPLCRSEFAVIVPN